MRRSMLFALELRFLTIAARLFGVEMQHPGVEKDVTVLWCRSASERDVSATAAPGMSNPADAAAAGRACRHKQLLSAPIDAASVRDPSAAVLLVCVVVRDSFEKAEYYVHALQKYSLTATLEPAS